MSAMKTLIALLALTGVFQDVRPGPASASRVEDIYIARSMRESQVTPTEFCSQSRTGFGANLEDVYTFRSTATRASDGLITDTDVNTIGRLRACFGTTAAPATLNFYGEGSLGTVTFTGIGECLAVKQDYPEPGLVVARCFLELRDLPSGYVGGQLTTNTMRSRAVVGETTDPPGYTQLSIATIRLWKRR